MPLGISNLVPFSASAFAPQPAKDEGIDVRRLGHFVFLDFGLCKQQLSKSSVFFLQFVLYQIQQLIWYRHILKVRIGS